MIELTFMMKMGKDAGLPLMKPLFNELTNWFENDGDLPLVEISLGKRINERGHVYEPTAQLQVMCWS